MMFFKKNKRRQNRGYLCTRVTGAQSTRPANAFNSGGFNSGVVLEALEPRLLLSGTVFEVNSLVDSLSLNGDDDFLTLREALEAANTNVSIGQNIPAGSALDVDQIIFDLAALQAEVGVGEPLRITLDGAQLEILDSVDIQGPGEDVLSINANQLSRVFQITGDQNTTQITNLAFTQGFVNTGNGLLHTQGHGGGIFVQNATLTLINSTLTHNSADRGGGIYNDAAILNIIGSSLTDNIAFKLGGGIFNDSLTLTVTHSDLSSNTANEFYGGGIMNDPDGSATIINSTISGNSAVKWGGGIANYGIFNLINSTITGNAAVEHGAGIYNRDNESITIANSIITLNQAPTSADIRGTFTSHNNIIGLDSGFIQNPTPGADSIWGTADDDHGNLQLKITSLAINLGDNALAVDASGLPLTTDINSNPRIAHQQVDIGAYEYQRVPAPQWDSPSTHVTTLADTVDSTDGQTSLREAITHASINSQPLTFDNTLTNGTITLDGYEIAIYQSIILDATSINHLTIDANHRSRVFFIENENAMVTFTALTITHGNSPKSGGGIFNRATLSINDSIITQNTAPLYGGGIYNRGTLTIDNTHLSKNIGVRRGGGIYIYDGALTINHSIISENFTNTHGGGIYNYNAPIVINMTTLSDNESGSGGGLHNHCGTVILTHATVKNNSTYEHGGGIWNGATITISNSTITGNTARDGGGLNNASEATMTVNNTIIVGNSARGYGGGINSYEDVILTVTNSTITGNIAGRFGGGISGYSGLATFNNTIIALNTAPLWPTTNDTRRGFLSNNSLVSTDPHFVRNPSPGADGEWATADDDLGDLRLKLTSPGVNTGDNALLPLDDFDLDGDNDTAEVLPVDGDNNPRIHNAVVDMGAYENVQPLPALVGDFNGDESIDIDDADLLAVAIDTGNANPLFDLDGDQQTNAADGQHLITNILNMILADTNLDRRVDVTDLSTWATGFGQTGALFSQGDANFDGQVDVQDLSLWATNFGKTSPLPPPVTAPLTQSSAAIADSYILDTASPTSSSSSTFWTSGAGDDGAGDWSNITKLLGSTSSSNQRLDIIKNVQAL